MKPGKPPTLTIYQGDTKEYAFRVRARNLDGTPGDPVDLTGCTAKAQVRKTADATTVLAEWTAEVAADQVTSRGLVLLSLTPTQTAALPAGKAVWDAEVVFPGGGDVQTYLAGDVEVTAQVTRP